MIAPGLQQKVHRLYNSEIDSVRVTVGPATLATWRTTGQIPGPIAQLRVDPTKPIRDVWAVLVNDVGAAFYIIDADLVAFLDGAEVYRQKIIYQGRTWGTAGTPYWLANVNNNATGSVADDILAFKCAGATEFFTAPWRINITADTFAVYPGNDITDQGASNWQCELMIRSQRGI